MRDAPQEHFAESTIDATASKIGSMDVSIRSGLVRRIR